MANLILSNSFLNTDLSNLLMPSQLEEISDSITEELAYALDGGYEEADPIITNNGKTYTYKNPIIDGFYGSLKMNGSAVINYDNNGDTVSASISFNSFFYTNSDGKLTVNGSVSLSANNSGYSYRLTSTGGSYVGNDGSKWSVKSSISESYKYNAKTDAETYSYSESITSYSSSDAAGNSISFSGSYKYNDNTEEYTGFMTSITLKVGSTSLSATGLKITYDDLHSDDYSFSSLSDALPSFLSGNDTITVSSTDIPKTFYSSQYFTGYLNDDTFGYAGNDKITGSNANDYLYGGNGEDKGSGNDNLIGGAGEDSLYGEDGNDSLDGGSQDDYLFGGAGADKITGGSGSDTFIFDIEDYDFSILSKVSFDTVTDFKIIEGDSINLYGFGDYFGVVANKAAGIREEYQLFYSQSDGTIYFDAEYDGQPVAIVKLTGNPKITDSNFEDLFYFG